VNCVGVRDTSVAQPARDAQDRVTYTAISDDQRFELMPLPDERNLIS